MASLGPGFRKSRKLAYRVGSKRGTIMVNESGEVVHQNPAASPPQRSFDFLLQRIVWREMPFFPGKTLIFFMWSMPVISFLITIWLVLALLGRMEP